MNLRPSKFNHVFWADLYGKGVMEEIVVIAQDKIGNVWYIPIKNLDEVDRRRIVRIITDRRQHLVVGVLIDIGDFKTASEFLVEHNNRWRASFHVPKDDQTQAVEGLLCGCAKCYASGPCLSRAGDFIACGSDQLQQI